MTDPPKPDQIYAPPGHDVALDPDRPVVVGARGMGKSFWAGAYASADARLALAKLYTKLNLDKIGAVPGFTGELQADAPSPKVIAQLLSAGYKPEAIWRAVLRLGVGSVVDGMTGLKTWKERLQFVEDVEATETALLQADAQLGSQGRRIVFVFDALDKLADNWPQIRELTRSILRTALECRIFRGIRVKIFIRPDQYDDENVFNFPDASKLKAQSVRLEWNRRDLYGLLFTRLARSAESGLDFQRVLELTNNSLQTVAGLATLPPTLREDEISQEKLFDLLAGKYMGADHRKGRTYTWLTNHLMDAKGEVSPRSFLGTLQEAASALPAPKRSVVDPAGLRAGIQSASQVRLNQLLEDYQWVELALAPLADQRVPCDPTDFESRWREARTVAKIKEAVSRRRYLGPVELEGRKSALESALLGALIRLGVIERRQDGRINMPDIYRVAAKLSRKGGVPLRKRR